LEDIYSGDSGWTALRREAGLLAGEDPEVDELSRRLGWLLHVDEPARIGSWRDALTSGRPGSSPGAGRRLAMLAFQLKHRGALQTAEETVAYLTAHDEIRKEFDELSEVLSERVALPQDVFPVPEWPLALHRHYTRRELLAAVGYVKPGEKGKTPQGGILKLETEKRELLLVTLDKSGRTFSPTTRYRDYAISTTLFHWETQSIASVERESGKRYIGSPANGWTFHLFVRTDPDGAYAYTGPVTYLSHEGDRPIAITWRLEYPLPAALYQRYATLTQG
jgi:hypothetical protein